MCGRNLRMGDEFAGKQVRCPGCRQVMTVPAQHAPAPPPGRPETTGRTPEAFPHPVPAITGTQPQYPQYPAAAARPVDWSQRAGWIGGFAAIIGGLSLLAVTFYSDGIPPTSVIVAMVLAFVGGVGAVVLSLLFRDLLRSVLLTLTGILVLVALVALLWAIMGYWMSPVHFVTFVILPLVVGGMIARRWAPQSELARWVLLGLATAAILVQLIWGILLIAEATRGAKLYARMLGQDRGLGMLPLAELILLMISVWGVMVIGLVSSLVRTAVRPLTTLGIIAFLSFSGTEVVVPIIRFVNSYGTIVTPFYFLVVLAISAFLLGGSLLASVPFAGFLAHIQRMFRPGSSYPGHVGQCR